MIESGYRIDQQETPWDMPHEIYWDKTPGSTIRRAQWTMNNCPDLPFSEVQTRLGVQPDEMLSAMGVLAPFEYDLTALPGAPTEEEMRDQFNTSNFPLSPLTKNLSPNVQKGFLQMYRTVYLHEILRSLTSDDLDFAVGAASQAVERLDMRKETISFQQLRIVLNSVNSEASMRRTAELSKKEKK